MPGFFWEVSRCRKKEKERAVKTGRFLILAFLASALGGAGYLALWAMPHQTEVVEKMIDTGPLFDKTKGGDMSVIRASESLKD